MTAESPTFTRAQIMDMIGIDAKSLDYWSKSGVLTASGGGGGKGKHRQFSAYEVTTAAILNELQKLGVGGNALRHLSNEFSAAITWFSEHGFIGYEDEATSLLEYRNDIEAEGFAYVPDTPALEEARLGTPTESGTRKMSWEDIVEYHRNHLKSLGTVSNALVRRCSRANYQAYLSHKDRFFAVSPSRWSISCIEALYLTPADAGGFTIHFNAVPEGARSYLAVNVTGLKRDLWASSRLRNREPK